MRRIQPRRTSLSEMLFPGRSHRSSNAAAEKERASRELSNGRVIFLTLPGEIRNYIYDLVVPQDRSIGVSAPRDLFEICPLLGVCRQIQAETMPIFFGNNTFMILLRSLAKRSHHHLRQKKPGRNFTENAFASLRDFQLVNNYLCRVGRQRLPHCLHLDGVVIRIDRNNEKVTTMPPMCSSGISLLNNSSPQPFRGSDDHPCFSACCLKSRKEAENHLKQEVEKLGVHFKHRRLSRQDLVDVGELSFESHCGSRDRSHSLSSSC